VSVTFSYQLTNSPKAVTVENLKVRADKQHK
jgi:hypothetical protein